jgi:predicted phage terminase large subunit-like protein
MALIDKTPEKYAKYPIEDLRSLPFEAKLEEFYQIEIYPDVSWWYREVMGDGCFMQLDGDDRLKFIKHLCTKDLYYWTKIVLRKDLLQEQPNREMAEKIMIRKEPDEQERKLICEPRGTYKTTLATVGYTTWVICKDPNISVQIDSETDKQAESIYQTCRDELATNPMIIEMFGEHKSNRWNNEYCFSEQRTRLRRDPTMFHTGVDSSINGYHPDICIFDDPHSEQNSAEINARDKVEDHYKLLTPLVDKKGEIIVIMTRWHEDDLAGRILEKMQDAFSVISIKSCYNKDGSLYAPGILSEKYLKRARETMGVYRFSANYENDPKPDADSSFRVEWLRYYEGGMPTEYDDFGNEVPVKMAKYMSIDASWADSNSNTGKDPTAWVVCGFTEDGRTFILDIINKRVNPTAVIDQTFETVKDWNVLGCVSEHVNTQKGINVQLEHQMVERNEFFVLDLVKQQQRSKGQRIAALTPLFQQGKVYISKHLKCYKDFIEQYTHFSPGAKITHDDILDALEMCITQYRTVGADVEVVGYDDDDEEDGFEYYDSKTGRIGGYYD